ncbi:MAG: right-handed parallel beta-helix repeat-containing protein, partial [Oscillatoriales cyanobacterium C42_A2020_001]|nr:right-handed parallel beta-helix repeat-containing protein [Leptolyngbyaceae cyanobacterium C42_A2020_001]
LPPSPISPSVGATFTTGPGIGYSSSYTGLKGFIPIQQQPGQNITFAEAQAFVDTGEGSPGANLVLGHRFYDSKSDRIYGGYLAFDHRNTGKNGFNQIGLGVETLGKSWDARLNAYLPIGDTRQLASERTNSFATALSDPFFQGNFLARNRTLLQQIDRRYEAAAAGVDVEAGGKIASLGQFGELRGYGGLYYFGAPGGEGTVGWRTRLEARPTENLQLGLALSRDNNYGTNLVFNVGVTFPINRSNRDSVREPLLARLGDSVYRNSNIVIDQQREVRQTTIQDTQLITNPTTGQPWRFRHAVPGVGTGDGTFENPTGTVAAALAVTQPDDIVYVQPGTNPGIPAFTIPDRVQVLSTGPIQRIDTVELGNFQLPLSGAGVLPSVVGTVTLGNSTTLSGFAITAANGAGIVGNNITQTTVRDNAIANTGTQGILLNNVQGQVAITDNTIQQAGAEGVSLLNNAGQVDLLLTRNQISNNGSRAADGDGVNIELRNNAGGNVTITNNTITNNQGTGGIADGVDVKLFNAANSTFNIADNAITGNQLNGVGIDLEATAQGTFTIARNNLSNNRLDGVALLLSNDARGQFNLDGNTIANNQFSGFQAVVSDRANATLNLTNNTITNNQDTGILLQTSDQAQVTATLLSNSITNNVNDGILTLTNDAALLRFFAASNIITGNGFSGISLNTFDTARTAASLQGNTITGNTFSDLDVFNLTPGTTTCLQPLNNAIGSLVLDDSNGAAGQVQVEAGSLPTNSITTSDLTFWSGTTVPAGTCGF